MFIPVLRIQNVYPRSRTLIFTHPGSWNSDPGSKNGRKSEVWTKNCHSIMSNFCIQKKECNRNMIIYLKMWTIFFLTIFKIKNVKLCQICGYKIRYTNTFFPPLFSCCFCIRDLVSRFRIRNKPIPDPESRIQVSNNYRIPYTLPYIVFLLGS